MGASAKAMRNQKLETSTTIQTKNITGSHPLTTSTIGTKAITGSHLFEIVGYSLTKGIGIGKRIRSDVFTVGGYDWRIEFYPDGQNKDAKNFISIFLLLVSKVTDVKAQATFTILQHNGASSNLSSETSVQTFKRTSETFFASWGIPQFAKRTEFESSEYLKDDAFIVKCTVTVIKEAKLEVTKPYGVLVPPSNLNQNLANLLESGNGTDVTFIVKGKKIKAHRWMLVARSAVFNAELFGCKEKKWIDIITVEDIEVPVFKSMLYFIYTDSLPNLKEIIDDDDEKQDLILMTQHLLIAANRYQLERLRLMCEELLFKNLSMTNIETTLILAEQHNCSQLKAVCLKFMSTPENFKAVAQTGGFHNLVKKFPILKDI